MLQLPSNRKSTVGIQFAYLLYNCHEIESAIGMTSVMQVGASSSAVVVNTTGVPRGSVLGPILVTFYVATRRLSYHKFWCWFPQVRRQHAVMYRSYCSITSCHGSTGPRFLWTPNSEPGAMTCYWIRISQRWRSSVHGKGCEESTSRLLPPWWDVMLQCRKLWRCLGSSWTALWLSRNV